MLKKFLFTLVVSISLLGIGLTLDSCTQQPTEPIVTQTPELFQPVDTLSTNDGRKEPAGAVLAAKHLAVSWPFYNWTSSSGWTDYTTSVSTHRGADQYSHDLSRPNCEGIGMYAGISGQVVVAGDQNNGYGNTVVVYDWGRHVAVRYSHMRYIAVYHGQWVGFRQYLGQLGHTGNVIPTSPGSTGAHLHITAYENIDHFSGGYPVIPTLNDATSYSCMIDWVF